MMTSNTIPQWAYPPQDGRRYKLSQLIDYAAATRPDEPALADGARVLTFAQLQAHALSFASRLRAAGVGAGQAVVVLAEKSALIPIVSLAAWRIGAIYVPLDPAWPQARLETALGVLPLGAVVSRTPREPPTHAPAVPHFIYEDLLSSDVAAGSPSPIPDDPDGDESQTAYIIFTSGSTGVPKGVQISRGSLLDYFSNHNSVLRFNSASRVFSLAPFYFDVSIEDTLLPLSLGAFVYQYHGIALGAAMRRVLRRERITHLIAVSTLLGLMTEDAEEITASGFPHLTMVMTGAEVCDPKVINTWKQGLPKTRVINAYGPTEATIVAACHEIEQVSLERERAYPIGRPLPRVLMRLVDSAGQVIPPSQADVPGELWIGGTQVMAGYIGQPQATAKVLRQADGVNWYLSGDICRYNAQGELEFVGRHDDEIKLGGRRIHLGEVRQIAISIEGIQSVAVGLVDEGHAPQIALVAVTRGDEVREPAIRERLARSLPSYMVPTLIVTVTSTQLGSTGKTDEKALLQWARRPALAAVET